MREKRREEAPVGRAAYFAIGIIVLFICAVIISKTITLEKTLKETEAEYAGIQEDIREANALTEDIENEIKYRDTEKYIEDQAREMLGLKYPDEIILEPEKQE